MLPIVQRELRLGARDPRLYSRRLRWGFLQAVGACLILLASRGSFRPSSAHWFFKMLSSLALFLCLLEGLRKTSDAISTEKREGTLGLLFLSTLTGADVVLGKFSAALLRSFSVLLPFLPILATSLLVGGTTLGEFWRVALTLATSLGASLSICLLVSGVSRQKSFVAALFVLSALCSFPLLALVAPGQLRMFAPLSPLQLIRSAADSSYSRCPRDFWIGFSLLSLLSLGSLASASIIVPHLWQVRRVSGARSARRGKKPSKRRSLLDENPVLWLSYDGAGFILPVVAVALLLIGLLPFFISFSASPPSTQWVLLPAIAALILSLSLYLRVILFVAPSVAEARLSGSLNLLLTTPLSVNQIVNGYWLALWKTIRFPCCCLAILIIVSFVNSLRSSVPSSVWISKGVVEALVEIPLLGGVGMWMGLTARTRGSAIFYTFLLGGVLPWCVCIFTLAVQIVLLFQALHRVKSILARLRMGNAYSIADLLRPAITGSPHAPPVIR